MTSTTQDSLLPTEKSGIEGFFSPSSALCIALMLMCWMLPGLFGREPWKPDEAYTFGLIWQMVRDGNWLVPHLAGEAFMEKPPLFFWTAAGFIKIFGHLLDPVSAARIANVLYVGITLACIARAARLGQRGLAIMALVGTPGLIAAIHLLSTDLALMAGMSMGTLGLMLCQRSVWKGGVSLGTGLGLAFMAKGLMGPGILLVVAFVLPFCSTVWRQRGYLQALAVAGLAALPWLLAWPAALYLQRPELFAVWFWDNNLGRFLGENNLGPSAALSEKFSLMSVFLVPGLPLALSNIWRELRDDGRLHADTQVALLICAVVFVVVFTSAQFRGIYMLPILPALALLAGRTKGGSKAYNVVLLVIASLLATILIGWFGVSLDWSSAALDRFFSARWISPPSGRIDEVNLLRMVFVLALFGGLVWVTRRSRHVLMLWSGGVAVIWFAFIGFFLPWLAPGNDYRGVMNEVVENVAALHPDCVASKGLGEPQRAMLDFYANLRTERRELGAGESCPVLLVQFFDTRHESDRGTRPFAIPEGWRQVWQGGRPGDSKERFMLLKRESGESLQLSEVGAARSVMD